MIFKNKELKKIYLRSFAICFTLLFSIGIVVFGITVSYKNIRKKAFSDNSSIVIIEKGRIKLFDFVIEF